MKRAYWRAGLFERGLIYEKGLISEETILRGAYERGRANVRGGLIIFESGLIREGY